ncbi:MAG: TIGR01212 family radical SAM protein [Muribaculaceae bacterium]|nr:TIGR01212 family radical SAM protein [Muribaculaceae bacterium]
MIYADYGYYDFGEFLKSKFNIKVQKISLNAGFSCPNRDGNKGFGGCTYCNNQTFNPDYCKPEKSITKQLEEGKLFFATKYPQMKYIAYFQAYTNTYGDADSVISLYEEALAVDDVVGIIIGTRPDCMPDKLLNYLSVLSQRVFVLVEYGVETANDNTLIIINRGHSWGDTVDAIMRTNKAGVMCGAHIILGLPGENVNDMLYTAVQLAKLPISTLKIHQLQLIRGTKLLYQVEKDELRIIKWNAEEYIRVCAEFIQYIPQRISLERFVSQSPADLLVSPKWGLKNYEFTNLFNNYIKANKIKQGANA